jgi:two-component sensor histidine kinase
MVENSILSKWALSLGRRSARERMAHLFCELSVRTDSEDDNQSSFDFPLTQEQLADALGLTSDHVNRTLQGLRAEGLITVDKRRIWLSDVAQLRRIGGFDPAYLHQEGPSDAQLPIRQIASANHRADVSLVAHHPVQGDDLLLRETNHRSSNDLQMVVGLLGLQSRRAPTPEVRQALTDAGERVAVLARARRALHADQRPSLDGALRQVCEALHAQAEPRNILVSMQVEHDVHGLSQHQITTLALVVNELATNAIKHAFEDGRSGHIRIMAGLGADARTRIIVDDDGLPFPTGCNTSANSSGGLGLDLAKRLMSSISGQLIPPPSGKKAFELHIPILDADGAGKNNTAG